MNKVYVLVTDSIYPCVPSEIRVRVYKDRALAEKDMETEYAAEVNDWCASYGDDAFEVETCDGSRSIWESGGYETNHISWRIDECEVQ